MDFSFTEEQENFRQDIRTFLSNELPPDWVDYFGPTSSGSGIKSEYDFQVFKDMARKLGEKGWLSIFWPKEYGGQACSHIDYTIFLEEIGKRNAIGLNGPGVKMLAPVLIDYGTEEQKERHLKPIATGQEFWTEAFSETESGSDLFSIKFKAKDDGDSLILNGDKIWCTFTKYSDWCFLLARTDPSLTKHKGLSFILVDLATPGVTVNPIYNILDEPDFCEIIFDDVRVTKKNIVGGENNGYAIAEALLSYERSAIERVSAVHSLIRKLVNYIKDSPQPVLHKYRDALAQLAMEVEIGRLISYRVAYLQDLGKATSVEASMCKLFVSELFKRAATTAVNILGLYGICDRKDDPKSLRGWFRYFYLASFGTTIAGGTSEIHKNIIALRGLKLPKA